MWPWLLGLFVFSTAEVCYNDIFLHRINSLLPSSGPFCLARYQDRSYEIPVLNEDQIIRLSLANQPKEQNPVLYRFVSNHLTPVQLPAALFGDQCTSIQLVEIARNLTSECALVIGQRNCASFSPANIFSNLVSIRENETYTLPVSLANGTEGLSTQWTNGFCQNIFHEAELRLFVNGSYLESASLRLKYSSRVSGYFNQKYSVVFVDSEEGLEPKEEQDERVYAVQAGSCEGSSRTSIIFKQSMSTGCAFRVNSCDEAAAGIRRYVERNIPSHLLANASADPIPAVKVDGMQPATSDCILPLTFRLEIFYARVGLTTAFIEQPVALQVTQDFVAVAEIRQNFNLLVRVTVRFTDASSEATPFFSGLPYIDLRLPADAFYPFIRSPSSANRPISSLLCLLLLAIVYE